jgi:hypothetical protein
MRIVEPEEEPEEVTLEPLEMPVFEPQREPEKVPA